MLRSRSVELLHGVADGLKAARFFVSSLTLEGAVASAADGAGLAGDEAANGAEVTLGQSGWRSLGREVVGRVRLLNDVFFQKLAEVFAEPGKNFEINL